LCISVSKIIEDLKACFEAGDIEGAKIFSHSILEWASLYKESLTKIQKEAQGFSFIDFLTREEFMKVVYDVVFLAFPNEQIFFNTGDEKIDSYLYMAKEYVIKIVGQLISYIKPHLHMKALKDTDFIRLIEVVTPKFLEALIEIGSNNESGEVLKSDRVKSCASSLFTISSQLVYVKEYKCHYEQYGLRIFTDIGFPFLRTLEAEITEANDNPSEFVKLSLDICDRQRMVHVKSQAARFIETIADKLASVFTPLCQLCCEILDYAVTQNQDINQYPLLKQHYPESKFFTY